MAVQPLERRVLAPTHRLLPLTPAGAHVIARWPRSNGEAFWLAPRTPPPITADKIVNWAAPGRQQLVLFEIGPAPDAEAQPVAYGELNVLNIEAAEYWLGHLIVDPLRRGQGLGAVLTRLLVQRATTTLGARRISLVVFPENKAAVRCYQQAGFQSEAHETHYFPIYIRRARLLRMALHA
jgi:RimJ/RimL family protein N-acetyltransferase